MFGGISKWRRAPSVSTSRRFLVDNRSNILDQLQFEEALDTVARGLFIEGKPQTVDVLALLDLFVRRGYHPSELFAPEGPQAAEAQMTDFAGKIQVTLTSGTSDSVIGMDEVGVI